MFEQNLQYINQNMFLVESSLVINENPFKVKSSFVRNQNPYFGKMENIK